MKIKKRYCTQCSQAKENFPTILKKQKRICVECYTKLYGSIADMEAQKKPLMKINGEIEKLETEIL